jgi:hypothetical protein
VSCTLLSNFRYLNPTYPLAIILQNESEAPHHPVAVTSYASPMTQLSKLQLDAAGPFTDLIANGLGGEGRAVQTETAIASISRLAGSLLLRSFNFDLQRSEPGTVILSDEANTKGPELANIAASIVQRLGLELDAARARGKGRGHAPNLSFLQSMTLLQTPALQICKDNGLTLEQAAQSAAVATGFIVKECARSIDVEVAFNAAVYGFIEGSKTVPPRLQAS